MNHESLQAIVQEAFPHCNLCFFPLNVIPLRNTRYAPDNTTTFIVGDNKVATVDIYSKQFIVVFIVGDVYLTAYTHVPDLLLNAVLMKDSDRVIDMEWSSESGNLYCGPLCIACAIPIELATQYAARLNDCRNKDIQVPGAGRGWYRRGAYVRNHVMTPSPRYVIPNLHAGKTDEDFVSVAAQRFLDMLNS